MKVLYAAEYYPFYAAKVIYELNKRLSARGVRAKVITSDIVFNQNVSSPESSKYATVTRLSAQRIAFGDTSYVLFHPRDWSLIKKQLDVDLIHLHFLYGFLPLYIGFIKRIMKLGIPVIATSHGLTSGYSSIVVEGTAILLRKITKNLVLSQASAVTTISQIEYDYLKKTVPAAKLHFIPNGVDTTIFKPSNSGRNKIREEIGLNEQDFVVLFFAQLRAAKGVTTFLKSMSNVIEKTAGIKFLIAGSGPLDYLVKEAQRKFPERLFAIDNYFVNEDVPTLFNATDVYILPSYVEGMPLSVMEAMACGKPVIATNVSDVPHLVENGINGVVISPGNVQLLSKSIIDLAGDPSLRSRMGQENRKKMEKYDWGKIANSYYSLYTTAVKN